MELNGVAYSHGHLHRLSDTADCMADDVSAAHIRFETSSGGARAALGDDDYARMYWQTHGRRMESIGAGLELLATALREEAAKLQRASKTYKAGNDASTLRT
ncbi:hypothetical protein [Nonomuraea sp. NPDC049400]|uniref:hypothetical protein n=1 Tax=Nonomuraea sp. NPDC049400 TaxID=3364352 RepID=UPI003798CC3C